jgi:hypothetical protein
VLGAAYTMALAIHAEKAKRAGDLNGLRNLSLDSKGKPEERERLGDSAYTAWQTPTN